MHGGFYTNYGMSLEVNDIQDHVIGRYKLIRLDYVPGFNMLEGFLEVIWGGGCLVTQATDASITANA